MNISNNNILIDIGNIMLALLILFILFIIIVNKSLLRLASNVINLKNFKKKFNKKI